MPQLAALPERLARSLEAVARRLRRRAEPSPSVPRPQAETAIHPGLRFAPPGHFYSPIPDLDELARHASRVFAPDPAELPGIDLREAAQLALLDSFRPLYADQPFGPTRTAGRRYWFENAQYSYSDALCYHFMLRTLRPRRVIEVGSGFSSCVALDTADTHLGGALELTCIEPYPESLQGLLRKGDLGRIELLARPVQDIPLEVFARLQAGDFLFIDSTHVVKVGGDVNYLYFEVLPRLRPGVYVHIHDIFYPFEYPRGWIEEGRVWSEAYLLRAFLLHNRDFEITLFNTFLETRHPGLFEAHFPLCLKNPGGSIWLRRL